ncbi:MAG TPA: DUF418 domain-containing protein [Chitinophagaceae bacterium]|nr:DUF418 domain-containing protein [Chitinophagaceae bacterium]
MSITNPAAETNLPACSAPVNKKERILFLDSIRGVALLGILLMNSMAQSQAHFFYDKMDLSQPLIGPNFYAWLVECFLFEGTMRGLFSILFGAGTILLLTRLTKEKQGLEPADIFYRRMLWLLVFGLINAFIFLWPGDILYPYALCGLLLFPFRNLSPRHLLWAVFFLLALSTYRENSGLYSAKEVIQKGQVIAKMDTTKVKLTDEQKEDLGKYTSFKEKNDSAGIAKAAKEEVKKTKGKGYLSLFRYYRDVNMFIQSIVFYNSWWDMLMFFFLGMALYKSGWLLGKKPAYLYAIVAITGIGIGLLLNYFYLRTQYQLRFDTYRFVQQWKFNYYDIRRICQTMGYLSLLILLYKISPVRKLLDILAPVGQMAFTNYLFQSIITSVIFYGFGLFATLQRYEVYYVVISIWLFQVIFSHVWLRYFRFGPFEWLWRSLTYLKRPPMLRRKAEEKIELTM